LGERSGSNWYKEDYRNSNGVLVMTHNRPELSKEANSAAIAEERQCEKTNRGSSEKVNKVDDSCSIKMF